jgi:hypothetical protein
MLIVRQDFLQTAPGYFKHVRSRVMIEAPCSPSASDSGWCCYPRRLNHVSWGTHCRTRRVISRGSCTHRRTGRNDGTQLSLNDAPCPPLTSHGASIMLQSLGRWPAFSTSDAVRAWSRSWACAKPASRTDRTLDRLRVVCGGGIRGRVEILRRNSALLLRRARH